MLKSCVLDHNRRLEREREEREREREMDYKLAAVKVLCAQLKEARQTASQKGSMTLGGILFQRAWLQGILVGGGGGGDSLFLDDGTALCLLSLTPDLLRLRSWTPGIKYHIYCCLNTHHFQLFSFVYQINYFLSLFDIWLFFNGSVR